MVPPSHHTLTSSSTIISPFSVCLLPAIKICRVHTGYLLESFSFAVHLKLIDLTRAHNRKHRLDAIDQHLFDHGQTLSA
ncbi:hypothetical protein Hanom_Chr06g00550301 [Helianthus anomalus]